MRIFDNVMVIVNGFPRSGKDEFFKMCANIGIDRFPDLFISKISSVDPVKRAMKELGIEMNIKDDAYRNTASEIKRIWDENYDGSLNYIKSMWRRSLITPNHVLFVDIREPENIKKVKESFENVITVFIDRKEAEKNLTAGNESDQNVKKFEYDFVIDNNGSILDLRIKSRDFLKQIINKYE